MRTKGHDYNRTLGRFLEICLQMAEMNDREVEAQGEFGFDGTFNKPLGYGYLAFSGYMRGGVKAVIDLQEALSDARSKENLAKIGEKNAEDFLEDIFGDREISSINEKDKERIRAFVAKIYAEWDEEDEGGE